MAGMVEHTSSLGGSDNNWVIENEEEKRAHFDLSKFPNEENLPSVFPVVFMRSRKRKSEPMTKVVPNSLEPRAFHVRKRFAERWASMNEEDLAEMEMNKPKMLLLVDNLPNLQAEVITPPTSEDQIMETNLNCFDNLFSLDDLPKLEVAAEETVSTTEEHSPYSVDIDLYSEEIISYSEETTQEKETFAQEDLEENYEAEYQYNENDSLTNN